MSEIWTMSPVLNFRDSRILSESCRTLWAWAWLIEAYGLCCKVYGSTHGTVSHFVHTGTRFTHLIRSCACSGSLTHANHFNDHESHQKKGQIRRNTIINSFEFLLILLSYHLCWLNYVSQQNQHIFFNHNEKISFSYSLF